MKSKMVWGLIILITIACMVLGSCAPAVSQPAAATTAGKAKPEGELIVAVSDFGNENFLPWIATPGAFYLSLNVNDCLIYYDDASNKFLPGLAEKWESSGDGKTHTFRIRKGVKWQDGYGEVTAEDIKFNFEKHAAAGAASNKSPIARNIDKMEIPDPYTLVVTLKNASPVWWQEWSLGLGGVSQGMVCKKYVETVGEETAGQKPVGSGPYKVIDRKVGNYTKFEAAEDHWRVVPEFKFLTIRLIPDLSTQVAMLKTKEVDLANVSAEVMDELKAAKVAVETSPYGGSSLTMSFGGLIGPEDKRYQAGYHNQDPWKDARVREAMNLAIDRNAIAKAIYQGSAKPIGAPLITAGSDKYQYAFDPEKAKKLLADAGYANGFTFEIESWTRPGMPEIPRINEAVASYWQKIGLNPKIVVMDFSIYSSQHWVPGKTANEISFSRISATSDMLSKAAIYFVPGANVPCFINDKTTAIYNEASVSADPAVRAAVEDKLQKYLSDNFATIPLVRIGWSFAWNADKVAPFPHQITSSPFYLEYVRHAKPLNTFRLYSPWPDR